jgi:hypothetical protein
MNGSRLARLTAFVLFALSTQVHADGRAYLSASECSRNFMNSELCTAKVRVNPADRASDFDKYALTVMIRGEGGERLMGCFESTGGLSDAPWIANNKIYDVRLYRVRDCQWDWNRGRRDLVDSMVLTYGQGERAGEL